jgi:hypothetical protein
MGARIPCYFSAHEARRTALVRQARAAAAASFALPRLLSRGPNPCLFKGLLLFSSDSQFFPFTESRFVLWCQKAALATFELAALLRPTKIRHCYLHREFNIVDEVYWRGSRPRAAREGFWQA